MSSTANAKMAEARRIRRRVLGADRTRRGVELSSSRPWPSGVSRSPASRLHADGLESHAAGHPAALDRPLALQLEPELDEERRRAREVVDHDAHVVHALDRHAFLLVSWTAPVVALHLVSGPDESFSTWSRRVRAA